MTLETIRRTLGWCTVINCAFLLIWVLLFLCAHDWIYQIHGMWFPMSKETFTTVHYTGIGLFKIGVLAFNLTPYAALRIVG